MEDKQEEVKQKSYESEQQEYLSKMVGCNKDHGKEIDLYSKSYAEKIDRIKSLMIEANKSEDSQKRSYYYAQALLVFYYLIPENDKEEAEVNKL